MHRSWPGHCHCAFLQDPSHESQLYEQQREVALDMVYDRRTPDYDPLQKFMELFEGVSAADAKDARAEALAAMPLFERLAQRIVDGEKNGLETDLDAGMAEKITH